MPSQPPDNYERQFDFTSFSQNLPDAQQPGQQIDLELNEAQASINQTISRLNEIQRDDGKLRDNIFDFTPMIQAVAAAEAARNDAVEAQVEAEAAKDVVVGIDAQIGEKYLDIQFFAATASSGAATATTQAGLATTARNQAQAAAAAAASSAQGSASSAAAADQSEINAESFAEAAQEQAQLSAASAELAGDHELAAQAAAQAAQDAVDSFNPGAYIPQPAVAPVADQILGYDGTAWVARDKSNPFNQDLNTTDSPSFVDLTLGSAESYAFKWISSGAEGGLYYDNLPIVSIDGLGLQLLQSGMSVTFPDSTTQTTAFQASMLNPIAEKLTNTINWTGDYDNGVTYAAGDGVRFNGAYYVLKAGIGAAGYDPAGYPASWTTHIPAGLPALASTNTFAASQVIETTSTTAALRVTQLGTGNAFVVEDSANPDASPFVINADGNIGIGRQPTSRKLEMTGNLAVTGQTNLSTSSGNINVLLVESHASNTADCVRITNLGSGNSFVVEDDTNPDSTPFVINAEGRVGIGTTTLSANALNVAGNSQYTNGTITISNAGSAACIVANQTNTGTTNNGVTVSYAGVGNAVSITNTGTGNSFVVNDEAGDTTPFVIDAAGDVGIGSVPVIGSKLNVQGNLRVIGNITQLGSATITVSSGSGVPLTVTNSGTGNSFVVNDEAGDTTPFVITADGRVGIGTATPSTGLFVAATSDTTFAGTNNFTPGIAGRTAVNVTCAATITAPGINVAYAGSNDAVRITNTGSGNSFVVEDSENPDSSPFVITADGNVGIGRSPTAGYKLDVAGQMVVAAGNTSATFASGGTTITAVSTAVGLTITNTGTGNSFVVNDESGDTSPFIIDASGNVMVGTTSAGGKMTVVGRSYFTDATSAGGNPVLWARQQSASSTAIAFQVTNQGAGASLRVDDESTDTTPFIVDAGGNVGVKTASPSTDFEVNGNAKVTTLNIGSSGTISALSYETTGLAVHVNRSDFPNEIAIVIGGVTYRIPARQV